VTGDNNGSFESHKSYMAFCSVCGGNLETDDKFCIVCGTKVDIADVKADRVDRPADTDI